MGDALAIALLETKGFSHEDFAFSHPGGALGRKLLLKVDDIMHTGDALPAVSEDASLPEALLEMTAKPCPDFLSDQLFQNKVQNKFMRQQVPPRQSFLPQSDGFVK